MNGLIISQKFPEVTYSDIYSYLIDTPSEFRKEKMKFYKFCLWTCAGYLLSQIHIKQRIYCRKIQSKAFLLSLITLMTSRESQS